MGITLGGCNVIVENGTIKTARGTLPEAGIDIWSFDNLVKIFQDIKAAKTTTMIISHQERLMKIADRIVVIENGKIKVDGSFVEVIG